MSEIINLRQFKKNKARVVREEQAEQNRNLFGRTKAEKNFAKKEEAEAKNFLKNNRLEPVDKPEKQE
ncbi:DUF4169 family protein [Ochrobactrum sp. Marseille-Q0166]|uniref:DUF4169 family protein n=1 Tax=Ochrobactrum sp. Marseille-Q0166 TaxID=2761105 RepID=UPI0016565A46|nr:DUF4169 family protein [Ochrobactrum sp. Marseille-Q0166]MBC8717127.1 DUF4169 family protein [Ochrobactrum sp. Marseille-Q0166]